MKKFLKIIGILFAIFLVLLVGAGIAVKMMFPPEKVQAIVQKQVSKYANRNIQIGGASLTIYPILGVRITGIKVSNTSRTNTIEAPVKLWKYLKSMNLDKRFVKVFINGKEHTHTYKNDASLKVGDKVKVSRSDFREGASLLELDELQVSVRVLPLLQRKLAIKKIRLAKLKVLVEVDSRGSFNFDDLLGSNDKKKKKPAPKKKKETEEKGEKEPPIALRLEAFEIDDAQIVYSNRKSQQEVVLDAVNQTLSAQFDSDMTDMNTSGLFEIKKMAVRGKNMPVRKSGMYFMFKHKLYVHLKKGNLRIDEITVGLQKTFMTLTGSVNGYDKQVRHLDLKLKTNTLKLQDLFKEVPPAMFPQARKMSVSGNAKLLVTVKGKLDAKKPGRLPAIAGRFQIMGGRFKYADLPKAVNALNADLRFTQDSLNIKKFAFKLGTNPVSLVAKVKHFKKPVVDVKLKADVDLGSLKDAVKMPKGTSAKGQLKANITAKGKVEPKNPEAIAVNGQLDLTNIVLVTPSVKKPVGLNGVFKFSNKEITLEKLAGKIGRSSFTMDMKITDYLGMALPKKVSQKSPTQITFNMNAPMLDVNELMGTSKGGSSKSGKSGKSSKGSSSGGGSDDTPIVIPKLPNVVVNGKIRVAHLQYKTLPIKKSAIDLSYKGKKLNFSLAAGLFKGKFGEVLALDLSNPNRISVSNTLTAKKVEANDFISRFNDIPKANDGLMGKLKSMDNVVYGKLDLTSKVKTSGITVRELKKNLNGTIATKLYRGKIKNATILGNITKTLPKLLKKFLPKMDNIASRKPMNMNIAIRDGKLHISKINIPMRKIALASFGTIGLDSSLNMKVNLILSKRLSRRILRQQKRLKRAAGGLLKKIGGKGIAGQVAGKLGKAVGGIQLIPADKKGRIVPILGALGVASKPIYKFLGFKGSSSDAGDTGKGGGDLVGNAKKMAKKQLDKLKKKAMAAANAAKRKALAAANAAKKKALAAANAAKQKAAKAAAKAAADAKRNAAKAAADARRKAAKAAADARRKAQKAADDAKKKAAKALGKW